MNRNLFEIGKNQYIVINEENDMKMATSKEAGAKEILEEENQLETAKNTLNNSVEKLQTLNIKNLFAHITMFSMMPLMFIFLCNITTFPLSLIYTALFYGPFKLLHVQAFGTNKKRYSTMDYLKKEISNLEAYITSFEKELNNKKKNIEFKTYEFINYEKNSSDLNIVSIYNPESQIEKPKVLSIGQKKNDK